jgi:L-aminopeptidase/D-esterase-like protein
VVLFEPPACGGASVRGFAPCTLGADWLAPTGWLEEVHAAFLTGRSVIGLASAAAGLTRFLRERGVGLRLPGGPVPIVVGAGLYDLAVGDPAVLPEEAWASAAAAGATTSPPAQGNVGAGAGATCGKLPGGVGLKGGLGTASLRLPSGAVVAGMVVVNALGAVVHPGAQRLYALHGGFDTPALPPENAGPGAPATTIALVVTNAALHKTHLSNVADVAHDGLARAIRPLHMMLDGDTVFAFSAGGTARRPAGGALPREDADIVGTAAADVLTRAVLNALEAAESIPGWPCWRELEDGSQA